ncbi:GNAT family N-acetyltransferase [Dactylosporangium sp. NPDC005572]|uniref:GNAT family N-acetyltransferase n=1 Tax=Dactylosporangium sp. NPDC005572 TaxID=3156889 RepID=UPI0033B9BAA6
MTTHSIHDVASQLAANRRYWCGWAGARSDTDLPTYRTDITHGLLNGVLRIRNRPLDEAIEEARQQLAGSMWNWWVGADSDEGTADGLLARGATQTGDMPIMAVDVTTVAGFGAPADLKICPVIDRAEMQEYVRAYAEPLGFRSDSVDTVVDHELNFGYPDVVRLAGIVDGRTVGTCTLSLATDVAALYCIATDPEYRRRSIATALTLEALRITRESGRRFATLQASSEGEPVYRRIGFETVARYRLFKLPE